MSDEKKCALAGMMSRRSRKVTQYRPDLKEEILCNSKAPASCLFWPQPGAALVSDMSEGEVNELLALRGLPASDDPTENKEALDNALKQTFDEQQQVCLMTILLLVLVFGYVFIFAY